MHQNSLEQDISIITHYNSPEVATYTISKKGDFNKEDEINENTMLFQIKYREYDKKGVFTIGDIELISENKEIYFKQGNAFKLKEKLNKFPGLEKSLLNGGLQNSKLRNLLLRALSAS